MSSLLKAKGKLPAGDQKEFGKIIGAVIDQWNLTQPVDIMMANRMVSTWMKMRYAENSLNKHGIYFEEKDQTGEIKRIKVNEMAYYLKQLEADFRSYYRLLQSKSPQGVETKSFLDFIEGGDNETKNKKKKN